MFREFLRRRGAVSIHSPKNGLLFTALAIAAAFLVVSATLSQLSSVFAADAARPAIPSPDDAEGWNKLGISQELKSDWDGAIVSYTKAIAIGERSRNSKLIADATGNLGRVYSRRGDFARAEEAYTKALKLHEELSSKLGMALQYSGLASIYSKRGDLARAEEMYAKSLKLYEELGSKNSAARVYGDLGLVDGTRGNFPRAEEMFTKSLKLYEEFGNKTGMAFQYSNLGVAHMKRGDLARAEEMYTKSLKLCEEEGRKDGMALQYGNLGHIHERQGDIAKACAHWSKSHALYVEAGVPHMVEKVDSLLRKANCASQAIAQSTQKPPATKGRDPTGFTIALLGPGVDYTDPKIAAHLARRSDGYILGADENTMDSLPYEGETSRLGTRFAQAVLNRVPNSRLIAVRLKTEGRAPGTKFAAIDKLSIDTIARHARIAVYVITDGKSNTNSKPDPLPSDENTAEIIRGHIVSQSDPETVFTVNNERTFITQFSDAHPGALPLFVLGVGPGALNAGDLWPLKQHLGFCQSERNSPLGKPLARCGPISSTFIVVAAADKSGKLRRIPEALADQVDFGVVTNEGDASELINGDMAAVLRLLEIVSAFPEDVRKTPQRITQQLLKIATNPHSTGPKFGILQ